jgi:hypothetical protein|tara:strand:+ start:61 stop:276 length:216 start_codon:yes stop_codon:yes gene_type:complete
MKSDYWSAKNIYNESKHSAQKKFLPNKRISTDVNKLLNRVKIKDKYEKKRKVFLLSLSSIPILITAIIIIL